jgi:hypothetical protein
MCSTAHFHADDFDLQIRGESQNLPAGAALADHYLPVRIQPNQTKPIESTPSA